MSYRSDMEIRAWQIERERLADLYKDVVHNTAERLGVDPVAFAKECQDGEAIADALAFTAVNSLTHSQQERRLEIFAMLAALKRAEPGK